MATPRQRFLESTPGTTIITVIGFLGALSALVTDMALWQRLAGFGFFLGIGLAGAGMLLARLRPQRLQWCRRLGMGVGLTTIGVALLGAGTLGALTGEGTSTGSDPVLVGIVCAVFGLVLTVLGVIALFATTDQSRSDKRARPPFPQ